MKLKTKFNTLAVIGTQYGDESKGAVVNFYAKNWANIVVRSQGGNNAGHTICKDGKKVALRSIPSGILTEGVMNVIAQGCVVNIVKLASEIESLRKMGYTISKDNLKISDRCHVVFPFHRAVDAILERDRINSIGTTRNGIGPCYSDKMLRFGIRIADIPGDPEHLTTAIHNMVVEHSFKIDPDEIDKMSDQLFSAYVYLQEFIDDTEEYLNKAIAEKKKILFEGAQAAMLDIDHGTYPYVTSSNTTTAGMATGSGVAPKYFANVIGVVKAYTTRVGNGPFITELDDETEGPLPGRIRLRGNEFGTVTGRPRRIGWLDLVQVKKAIRINGVTEISLRLVDVLSVARTVKVCVEYHLDDERTRKHYGDIPSVVDDFDNIVPEYKEFAGWNVDISSCKTYGELPEECRAYIEFVEKELGVPVTSIGVGPDETQTIYR